MMSIKDIALAFAQRKIRFHKDENWKDIKLFGLFRWCEISPYLVGNPAHLKTFKKGLVTTHMLKENKVVWCKPTEKFWNEYIEPIVKRMENESNSNC